MRSHVILFSILLVLSQFAFTQAESMYTSLQDGSSAGMQQPDFPYKATVTGDRVNIRSGPGTQYYSCGKVNTGEKVVVVGSKFSWSRIVAPEGCFSWISNQYVKISPDNPGTGIVTGDNVRVYAGAPGLIPMHSTSVQTKVDKGDEVVLLGEEQGGYYKIKPLEDCYLWIRSDYTQPIAEKKPEPSEPVIQEESKKEPADANQPEKSEQPVEGAEEVQEDANEAVKPIETKPSEENLMLEKFHDLEEKIKKEKEKPITDQDFKDIKIALEEIADNDNAGKAAKYAEYMLKSLERHELALDVLKAVRMQEAEMYQARQKIESDKRQKLAKVQNLGKYAVVGEFETSSVFGKNSKRFKLTDEDGKMICYAQAQGRAAEMNLEKFVGKKVGLVGTIEANKGTAGALVYFNDIEVVEL